MSPEEKTFQLLRPVCVTLANAPSLASLERLERLLTQNAIPAVPQLLEYTLYPLVLILKKNRQVASVGCVGM